MPFFTPDAVIRAVWTFLAARGFAGGSVLEPGQLLALRPLLRDGRIAFNGIEIESVSERIARRLFLKQGIRCEDFTRAKLATCRPCQSALLETHRP